MKTKQSWRKVKNTAEAVGGKFTENYSGRFMYGKKCCGIVTDDRDEGVYQAKRRGLETPRIDNMGLGWILYWPDIQKPADELQAD